VQQLAERGRTVLLETLNTAEQSPLTEVERQAVVAELRATAVALGADPDGPVPDDPDAIYDIYDILRESANRLGALYAQQITKGGTDDPAIIAMRAVDAEIRAIPLDDLDAQKALTRELKRRRRELLQREGG
jgi:hypothetical protein